MCSKHRFFLFRFVLEFLHPNIDFAHISFIFSSFLFYTDVYHRHSLSIHLKCDFIHFLIYRFIWFNPENTTGKFDFRQNIWEKKEKMKICVFNISSHFNIFCLHSDCKPTAATKIFTRIYLYKKINNKWIGNSLLLLFILWLQ